MPQFPPFPPNTSQILQDMLKEALPALVSQIVKDLLPVLLTENPTKTILETIIDKHVGIAFARPQQQPRNLASLGIPLPPHPPSTPARF